MKKKPIKGALLLNDNAVIEENYFDRNFYKAFVTVEKNYKLPSFLETALKVLLSNSRMVLENKME